MTREKLLDTLNTILIDEYWDFDNIDYPDEKVHEEKVEVLNFLINLFSDMKDSDFDKIKD